MYFLSKHKNTFYNCEIVKVKNINNINNLIQFVKKMNDDKEILKCFYSNSDFFYVGFNTEVVMSYLGFLQKIDSDLFNQIQSVYEFDINMFRNSEGGQNSKLFFKYNRNFLFNPNNKLKEDLPANIFDEGFHQPIKLEGLSFEICLFYGKITYLPITISSTKNVRFIGNSTTKLDTNNWSISSFVNREKDIYNILLRVD